MRRLTLLPLLILPLLAAAQEERPAWSLPIEEVPVVTRRTMKEIGVQRTQLDSTVLHDNISLSMADVLTQNANLFIKSYGRATLATAEFRGTSPSHTQVTWNGMRINSPMLGTVDFSMIPAFFIDAATLLHGASSIGVTGGALGGAVVLGTRPSAQRGWQTQYVQGVGSFSTFDQYLRVSYGGQRWSASTRAVYSTSDNDFRYTNYDKMELVYGPDGAVVDTYHPVERNRSGYFRDLQIIKEVFLPAFEELKDCLRMAAYIINKIQVNEHILDDPKYDNMFSVEEVNRLATGGMPFRDAYKKVGLDIEAGNFTPDKRVHHTHEGSIGNLCNDKIHGLMEQVWNGFNFARTREAENRLLGK